MDNKLVSCRGCASTDLDYFFDLGDQPFANGLTENIKPDEKHYPLALAYCKNCALVQLDYTADPKELFSNYIWVTSTSSTAVEYSENFCSSLIKRYKKNEINYVMEIASNDGTFLKPFLNRGMRVLGVDPASNIAEIAEARGINTYNAFFGEDEAQKIVQQYGKPSLLFARNVLPHVANTHDFVRGLRNCMGSETVLALEVHYAGEILDELHYDSIYHEHLCYFTIKSLSCILNQYGLHMFDLEKSPISGGSIVVYISLENKEKSQSLNSALLKEELNGYNDLTRWEEFAKISHEHKIQLTNLINSSLSEGKKIIGYGASARSSTMLNFCKIDYEQICCIADQNSMKQGLLTPGTHIPIVSAENAFKENPDTVIILAWNFKDEILKYIREQYGFVGEVILPLPFPPTRSLISDLYGEEK